MIDKTKQVIMFAIGTILIVGFFLTMGFSLGKQSVTRANQVEITRQTEQLAKERHDKERASVLSQELVEEFLVHYYTKEKLGENNGRIKPYLTDSAYREELARQDEPLNQVYKDYILDYRYSEAQIFLDSNQQEALVEVSYTVTYVADLEKKEQAMTNQVEKRLLRLGYSKVGDKLLVNHIQSYSIPLDELLNQAKANRPQVTSAVPDLPISTTKP
ncbi:TPA: hypothetical protein ACGYRP_000324 [Streptococcus pyogenes]|uniref:hypothetical protein n=1 Tax=Streptococcus pyogenes TaxID=1314 RepID=UPI00109D3078|nr:hypothetical protein [Streptococcus pyogenes]QCK38906.1 hypothetical protein ETT65_05030 [Streptococcus pyogenes]VGV98098.1 parvulin-like peptidyl-prolyl isomerase [Streptococcus pyogenes]VGW88739.1 parvulin-like peptidyl-prolyl isomerase [Streptococcus pyogenes]VGZ97469.1 parvulin-like peptidyl-prolyl isomerase [Streptococcus pyogenes]VHA98639.1 parvulin-like peptidyl-prolyl isomerase [Streptococcus pyogenes]